MPEEKLTEIEKELQRAKEELETLQGYIEEFSTFLPLAVCSLSGIGIIISVNKALEDLTGHKSIEIIGKPLEDIFLEKKKIDDLLKKAQEEEKTETKEIFLITKTRKEILASVAISVRKDLEGNFIGYFVSIIDITESKKFREELEKRVKERTLELEGTKEALINMLEDTEQARRRAEEESNRTLAIITNFTDGLLVFDREKKLSLINPQAEIFFGVKSENVVGQPILELTKNPGLEPLASFLGGEIKGVFRKELQIQENLILEVSTVPIQREEEIIGTLVTLHDITREKMVEKMKTEFVSISAHQLRTPLSAIKWTLRMLLDGDLGEITGEQKDFIEKTYKSNERMITLINDLLNVTRIEEGKHLYKPALASIESIVQSVINSLKEEIQRRKLKFEFIKPKKKLPLIRMDVEKIGLAIQNLIENAVRYTEPEGKVKVSLGGDKKEIKFEIEDTGVGIPENQKDRIFTKFFRGANVIRMETEGSGLGLFITKNIIEAHGGKIWFESEEGRGSTFFFTLPIKKEFEEFLKEF